MKIRWLGMAMVVAAAYGGWGTGRVMGFGAYINAGEDFLSTGSGSSFFGTPMVGVPLGNYDFGGTIGVKDLGNTDTIIRRDSAVSDSGIAANETISEIVVMHLMTVSAVDYGLGTGTYYLTLQSERGGPVTGAGSFFTQVLDGGTYTESFQLAYDIRLGSLTGPIAVSSSSLTMGHTDTPWSHVAPSGALLIDGINNLLNGIDTSKDFWAGPMSESNSDFISLSQNNAVATVVPVPETGWAGAGMLAVMGVIGGVRRRVARR